jgi:hypothetical protein
LIAIKVSYFSFQLAPPKGYGDAQHVYGESSMVMYRTAFSEGRLNDV